ncbi:hypothetical protein AtNW77_Chr1g0044701 [Arabidopsis thaliana]
MNCVSLLLVRLLLLRLSFFVLNFVNGNQRSSGVVMLCIWYRFCSALFCFRSC